MISQNSGDVVVHLKMSPATVRFNGIDKRVLRPATHGFCCVEFDSGEQHPISHPLEEWIMSILNQGATPGTSQVGTIFFTIDPPGQRSQEGNGPNDVDVNNIQTSM